MPDVTFAEILAAAAALGIDVGTKISELPAAEAALGTTQLASSNAGVSEKLTVAQIMALASGTAFPTGAADKDRFFRSDIGQGFYYVAGLGTWLQDFETIRPMRPMFLGPYTATAVGVGVWASTNATPVFTYLDALKASVYVDGTNNASNYWTIALSKGTGGAFTGIGTIGTSAIAGGYFLPIGPLNIAAWLGAGFYWLKIDVTKTGSPGNLNLAADLWSREGRTS